MSSLPGNMTDIFGLIRAEIFQLIYKMVYHQYQVGLGNLDIGELGSLINMSSIGDLLRTAYQI